MLAHFPVRHEKGVQRLVWFIGTKLAIKATALPVIKSDMHTHPEGVMKRTNYEGKAWRAPTLPCCPRFRPEGRGECGLVNRLPLALGRSHRFALKFLVQLIHGRVSTINQMGKAGRVLSVLNWSTACLSRTSLMMARV